MIWWLDLISSKWAPRNNMLCTIMSWPCLYSLTDSNSTIGIDCRVAIWHHNISNAHPGPPSISHSLTWRGSGPHMPCLEEKCALKRQNIFEWSYPVFYELCMPTPTWGGTGDVWSGLALDLLCVSNNGHCMRVNCGRRRMKNSSICTNIFVVKEYENVLWLTKGFWSIDNSRNSSKNPIAQSICNINIADWHNSGFFS